MMNQAAEAVKSQHDAIQQAIGLLQGSLNGMTMLIDPETESWRDVAKFAHVADMANGIIANYEEQA